MNKTMQFQAEKASSVGPKTAIISWYILCVAAALWLGLAGPDGALGDPVRQAALLACVILYVARAAYTLFVFVRRKVPWWEAVWGGSILGVVLFVFLLNGFRAPEPLGPTDFLGLVLYVTGSYIGTASERARHAWKGVPEHRGHLYTEGLFGYSRHVNYFADLLLFGGCAFLTHQLWTALVPLAMALNFVFVIIPAHDAYLATRYGAEFDLYAHRAKRLIPLLY